MVALPEAAPQRISFDGVDTAIRIGGPVFEPDFAAVVIDISFVLLEIKHLQLHMR